tara:strand:+ start:1288 stop:2421 length:1134 start_codon:yes stop_codon:yes gene_type:complete
MKKILFKKILSDCLIFFTIALLFAGLVIWIFQAVNHLDIMIEDGRDHITYLKFTLLIFPKVITKLIPFIFFLSFIYIITKYEIENELIIFWNFGVNKITVVNFFFKFSFILLLIQLILTSFIVPISQDKARSYLRNSSMDFIDNLIKPKTFNDAISNLTIYSDRKNNEDYYKNIYIKSGSGPNDFQITYAEKGKFINSGDKQIFDLFNGENVSLVNNKFTNLKFKRSYLNLSDFETHTTKYKKTQEVSTFDLFICYKNIYNKISLDLSKKLKIENCRSENLNNILKEFHKRFTIPLYIPALMLICLLVIIKSKENTNYSLYRFKIFVLGLFIIILSELSLRFVEKNLLNNLLIFLTPIILMIYLYLTMYFKLNFKRY